MRRPLILVDARDRAVGTAPRGACHRGRGLRHRAYLVMLYNARGELLLARRHPSKPLWPGFWDGTVAGHVESGETYASAARRRVEEEMRVRPRLRRVDTFQYTARWKGNGENEICAVFAGKASSVSPDPREVDAWKFVERPRGALTPWLRIALLRRSASRCARRPPPPRPARSRASASPPRRGGGRARS